MHVWGFPTNGRSPVFLGYARQFHARSDVAGIFGDRFTNAGFDITAIGVPAGEYVIGAYAHSFVTNEFTQVGTARITVAPPVSNPAMSLDDPATATVTSPFVVGGWAVDLGSPSGSGVDAIHVWAFPTSGGAPIFVGAPPPSRPRSDIATAFGAQFLNSGFRLEGASLPPGTYRLVAYAHSSVTGTFNNSQGIEVIVR